MEIDAFLADSVVVSEGKLYVQGGGWNRISGRQVPLRHSRVGIGILIRVPWTATNEPHRLEIVLVDADGRQHPLGQGVGREGEVRPLDKINAEFNVGRPASVKPGEDQLVPLAVNLDGIVFESPGDYSFILSIDDAPHKRLPFRVALAT